MDQKVVLRIAYFGANYFGFQRQPNASTIELRILEALKAEKLLESPQESDYASAGRTDKGVNAIEQTIAFISRKKAIIPAINSHLPKDIRVWASAKVPKSFHPSFDATQRKYVYFMVNIGLNVDEMQKACKLLVGTHNFRNFVKKDKTRNLSTVRTLDDLKIENKDDGVLKIVFEAQGFLWEQCRRIASHLLDIGLQKKNLDDTRALLSQSERFMPSPLPAELLILEKIDYPKVRFIKCQKSIEYFCGYLRDRLNALLAKSAMVEHILQKFGD
ncbi:MAG: tRNA pseudouridine(38-40) synthase TruA [Candidatus Hermodarchaeota archaeon]